MKGYTSVAKILELVLGLPLAIISGVLTLYYAPLPENLRFLIAGVLIGYVPTAFVHTYTVERMRKS